MALTRLTSSVVRDGRIVLYQLQFARSFQRNAGVASLCDSNRHHWRKHTQHCRTFTHLTRSHDHPGVTWGAASPVRTHRPSLVLPRRCLNVSVTGSSDLMYIPTPVESSYEFLEYMHDSLALPWWVTVLGATVFLRGVLVFPFAIWQQRVLARIENVQPEINTHAEHMKQQVVLKAKELNWSQKEMASVYSQQVKAIVKSLHDQHRCHSRKIFYVCLVQGSLWTSMTIAIGQMTGQYPQLFSAEQEIDFLPELTTQGALWFADLTQTDLLIPVMLGLVNLALVEMWSLRKGPLTLLQHRLVNWFRLVSVGMVPIATMMPAALSLYWLTSSIAGLAQFTLLRWPAFRRLVDIPLSPSELKHPYLDMTQSFKARYLSKKMF